MVGGYCALWGPSGSVRRRLCVVGSHCALWGPSTWVWLGQNVIDGLQPLESNKYQVKFDPG